MENFVKKLFGTEKEKTISEDGVVLEAKFEKEDQIVSALHMVGAGFETKGGCSLMLTESVENGVDAIIKYNELHKYKTKGKINVNIDNEKKRVIIVDNGTGFIDIKHVCEKPFDSLKKDDSTQTGKFARGLQGFRAFCKNLIYITKRMPEDILENEKDIIPSDHRDSYTTHIEFSDTSSKAKVKYIQDSLFSEYTKENHGTIAIYENWKPGQFEKFNVTMLLLRLQHHFGELVRQGEIKISVDVTEGRIHGIGPIQEKYQNVEPRDYSELIPIKLDPIYYWKNGIKGEIKFNLYLSEKGKSNRWNSPYLLYKGRPIGDGFISEVDEFVDNPIWKHKFLTGYITCDFCEINELRQGLKINDERDFLFKELIKIQKFLENIIREHSRGLYELKLQKQVNELVKDLQLFFKNKNIFNFKIAKSTGFLSKEDNEIEIVELSKKSGTDMDVEVKSEKGEGTEAFATINVENTSVTQKEDGKETTVNPDIGGKGRSGADEKLGSPGDKAEENEASNEEGFKPSDSGYKKPFQENATHKSGGQDKSQKKVRRPRPRGFGMVFQDDEFNEDLSWFDDVNSVIIINSQHPRYLARSEDETMIKPLMNYLAELYIWEITSLVHAKDEDDSKGKRFLDYKFEYFEHVKEEQKHQSENE